MHSGNRCKLCSCSNVPLRMFRYLQTGFKVSTSSRVCRGAAALSQQPRVEMTQTEIVLNDVEREILDTLMAAREHHGMSTTLRCAGGWVRDKLLGRDSHDIDIALDDISGKEFAEKVQSYQEAKGLERSGMGVIAANPDQSKHLETAFLRLHGLPIDLVHLRSERYTEESRIPTIEVGTPEEDARRRDFTINSLFYNINLQKVEDLTGMGMEDLKNGIIRTPLDPQVTFMDDPLRVLRAVRFASRFSFTLVPELRAAAASDEVRAALQRKITRERIGAEMAGCFDGPQPLQATAYLVQMQAFSSVFQVPETTLLQIGPDYGQQCVESLELATPLLSREEGVWSNHRRCACMAAMLLPLRLLTVIQQKKSGGKKKGSEVSLTSHIILEALKLPKKDSDQVELLHKSLPELCRISTAVEGLDEEQRKGVQETFHLRAALGTCLAKLKALDRTALAMFPLLYHTSTSPLAGSGDEDLYAAVQPNTSFEDIVSCTERLQHVVDMWGLSGCQGWPALMNGHQIVSAMELGQAGPILGTLMTKAKEWQYAHALEHATASDGPPPELVQYLKQELSKINA